MKLSNHVYFTGIQNPGLRVFDIIMKTDYGTSYNAYVLKSEKNALIETAHAEYTEEYLKNIREVIAIEDIDYVILNHTEPDHSGSLEVLLSINPEITVIGTAQAVRYLEQIANRSFKSIVVKKPEQLDLGDGAVLDFIPAPFLHWPDSMFTYFGKEKILFSCDMFGCHYCEPYVLDTHVRYQKELDVELLRYYSAIFGPFKKHVIAGMDKIKDLEIKMICPSHGPVLTERVKKTMDLYREWSAPQEAKKNIVIFYVSAYGYTKQMASVFEQVFKEKGIETAAYDVISEDPGFLSQQLNEASAVLFGSPTINRDALKPIWDLISTTDAIGVNKRPALVFGSYGWSGEAGKLLVERLKGIKYQVVEEPVTCQFKPSGEDIKRIETAAAAFAESLK